MVQYLVVLELTAFRILYSAEQTLWVSHVSRNPCAKLHSPERDKATVSVTYVVIQSELFTQWITLRENLQALLKYILNARKSQYYASDLYSTNNSERLTVYNVFSLGNTHQTEETLSKEQTFKCSVTDCVKKLIQQASGHRMGL
jgi:hypothetical protein